MPVTPLASATGSIETRQEEEGIVEEQGIDVGKVRTTLESFLSDFEAYAREIYGDCRREELSRLRADLLRQEPKVRGLVLQTLGDGIFAVGSFGNRARFRHRDAFALALMGGNNELATNFHDYEPVVTTLLRRVIGTMKTVAAPTKDTTS